MKKTFMVGNKAKDITIEIDDTLCNESADYFLEKVKTLLKECFDTNIVYEVGSNELDSQ